jgi:hypothetical protein
MSRSPLAPRPEPAWLRLDLHIVVAAVVILVLGWAVRERAGDGPTREIGRDGVRLQVPAGWLAEPRPGGPLVVRGEDAITRLEIRAEEIASELVSVESSLELARARRYGDLYHLVSRGRVQAGGRSWLRTEFAYAFKPSPTHAPRVTAAVEYASDERSGAVPVVTLHAPAEQLAPLERAILGTLTFGTEAP